MNQMIGRFTYAHKKGDGKAVVTYCPNCPDGSAHCELAPRGVGYCHRCHTGFSLTTRERLAVRRVLGLAVGLRRPKTPQRTSESPQVQPQGQEVPSLASPEGDPLEEYVRERSPEGKLHWRYLRGRGLTDTQIRLVDPRRRAIESTVLWMPVWDAKGVVRYVVGRSTSRISTAIRYRYPPKTAVGTGKSEHVWGIHLPTKNKEYILCEGILDAVVCHGGLAVLGSMISDMQASLIAALNPKRIRVAFDSDRQERYECKNRRCKLKAASALPCVVCGSKMMERQNSATQAIKLKRALPGCRVEILLLPRNEDPSDLKGDFSRCQSRVI